MTTFYVTVKTQVIVEATGYRAAEEIAQEAIEEAVEVRTYDRVITESKDDYLKKVAEYYKEVRN